MAIHNVRWFTLYVASIPVTRVWSLFQTMIIFKESKVHAYIGTYISYVCNFVYVPAFSVSENLRHGIIGNFQSVGNWKIWDGCQDGRRKISLSTSWNQYYNGMMYFVSISAFLVSGSWYQLSHIILKSVTYIPIAKKAWQTSVTRCRMLFYNGFEKNG